MPQFYFHVRDGRDILDEDGTAFPDAVTARVAAVHAMAEAIKDASRRFWDHPEWEMHVVGESGATVCRLTLSGDLLREPGSRLRIV